MTIAVTGSTGHLGGLVIEALLEHLPAPRVLALARDTTRARALADRGVEVRTFDYDRPDTLAPALEGVDRLLLVSGNAVGHRVPQHRAVIEAASAAGVRFLAYTSVLHADTATGPVAPEHRETEAILAHAPFEVALLRNGWYSENYLPTAQQAVASGEVLTSAGSGRVASAARADYAAAAAAVLAADTPRPGTYELSGDHAWDTTELARTIASLSGHEVRVHEVSPDEHLRLLVGAGVPEGGAEFVVGTDRAISRGELADTPGTLSALIGRPTTPLADTLRPALTQS